MLMIKEFWQNFEIATNGYSKKEFKVDAMLFVLSVTFIVLNFTLFPPVTKVTATYYDVKWWFWVFIAVLVVAAYKGIKVILALSEIFWFKQEK